MIRALILVVVLALGAVEAGAALGTVRGLGENSSITVSNLTAKGWLAIFGTTNRLTVVDGVLKLDGSPVVPANATIWTNIGGLIQPLGGQVTNRLAFTSGAADNATNVAVLINTPAWTFNGSRPLVVQNGGTNLANLYSSGGLTLGRNTEAYTSTPISGATIYSFGDTSFGDTDYFDIWIGVQDSLGTGNSGYFEAYGTTTNVSLDIHAGGNSQVQLSATDGYGKIVLRSNATSGGGVVLEPQAAASATPFKFGTSGITHTSGNLFEIRNNTTIKHSGDWDGAVTHAQAASEPAAPAAGYYTLFATNVAGKMTLKVRFPTGASQTIATEP